MLRSARTVQPPRRMIEKDTVDHDHRSRNFGPRQLRDAILGSWARTALSDSSGSLRDASAFPRPVERRCPVHASCMQCIMLAQQHRTGLQTDGGTGFEAIDLAYRYPAMPWAMGKDCGQSTITNDGRAAAPSIQDWIDWMKYYRVKRSNGTSL